MDQRSAGSQLLAERESARFSPGALVAMIERWIVSYSRIRSNYVTDANFADAIRGLAPFSIFLARHQESLVKPFSTDLLASVAWTLLSMLRAFLHLPPPWFSFLLLSSKLQRVV